ALDQAVGGSTVAVVQSWDQSALAASSTAADSDTGEKVFTVFMPLRANPDGTFTLDVPGADTDRTTPVVGAIEVNQPYAPIQSSVAHDSRYLALALLSGLLVVYLVVLRLAIGASRRWRRQSMENEHRINHDDLTGLLNRRGLITAMTQALQRDTHVAQT
ncbi:MAG TPA: hypothetical protein PLV68_07580, partial [Ilumatobacteraceae bacterium]|nr:hypothetical protein [Ilumatobacteraceae bacterium]